MDSEDSVKDSVTEKIDFKTISIEIDEGFVDADGPRRDAVILPGNKIRCHPIVAKKLQEAMSLFFGNENAKIKGVKE